MLSFEVPRLQYVLDIIGHIVLGGGRRDGMPWLRGIILSVCREKRGFVPRDVLDDLKSVLAWRSFLFPSLKLCLHSKSSSVPFSSVLRQPKLENCFHRKGFSGTV